MKMKNKLLLLFLAFLFFFTIKSNAQTYDHNNPYDLNFNDYGNDPKNFFTYDYFYSKNIKFYDFFKYQTKTSTYGNVYNVFGNVIYYNESTQEYLLHIYYNTYDYNLTCKYYYIKGSNCLYFSPSYWVNSSNKSHGNCVIFYDTLSDGSLNKLYFADQVNGTGQDYDNNVYRIVYNNDGSIYISALRCFLFL